MARARRALYLAVGTVIALLLAFEAYVLVTQREGSLPLPPLFGNFPHVRAALETSPRRERFSFAVLGDSRSSGTFERLAAELRAESLDFAVLLGDCVYDGDPAEHRYFRAECHDEYALPFPVFYVVGNHDVSADRYTLAQFEECYGPTLFSLVYQDCLFVFLRVLQPPFSNAESLEFLQQLRETDVTKYRRRFAFMHIPAITSDQFESRSYPEQEQFARTFEELGLDYVFAGDFHGYARVKEASTAYIVSGGGGAHLAEGYGQQFHHAVVMTVREGSVAERIVPVEGAHDLEDVLERFAIAQAHPWMAAHRRLLAALNVVAVVALAGLVGLAVRQPRPPPTGSAGATASLVGQPGMRHHASAPRGPNDV